MYKRFNVVSSSLIKEIRFTYGKKLTHRLRNALFTILISPEKSFLYKSKIFSYNYIFKNYKKTLMSNLRTIK